MSVIKEVSVIPPGLRPAIVDIQNIESQQTDDFLGCIYKSNGKPFAGITTDGMLYTAQIEADDSYNHFILVHNKRKGKIRLVQVDHCVGSPRSMKKNFSSSTLISKSESSLSDLHKKFGSKATKRLTEQKERLTMNIATVKDELEKTILDVKVTESAMDQKVNENTSIYRPKINRDASTRDDVYNLEDLVASHVLSSLETEAINIINTRDVSQFEGFVASNMNAILTSGTSQEVKIKKLSIFLYIQYLVKFMTTPMKNVTKKFVVCDKSIEVNNHILNTFTVNGPSARTRPVHMKDKSLCFILILAAIAMDYEVDLTNLAKDCKIGVKKALEVSRILAFNSSSKNKNVVTLKLPLPAPVVVTPKRRK